MKKIIIIILLFSYKLNAQIDKSCLKKGMKEKFYLTNSTWKLFNCQGCADSINVNMGSDSSIFSHVMFKKDKIYFIKSRYTIDRNGYKYYIKKIKGSHQFNIKMKDIFGEGYDLLLFKIRYLSKEKLNIEFWYSNSIDFKENGFKYITTYNYVISNK